MGDLVGKRRKEDFEVVKWMKRSELLGKGEKEMTKTERWEVSFVSRSSSRQKGSGTVLKGDGDVQMWRC